VSAPRLIGRDAELAEARAEADRAEAGELRCLLLVGSAGVGKTRLAKELFTRRFIGLSARAYPFGGSSDFGMWSEALEGHLRGLPAERISALCAGFLDDLAVLVRSVAVVRGGAPPAGEQPRSRVLAGLAALLGNLARTGPVVLLLDDVHLADASSWEALAYLARNLSSAPVLVVATARAAELDAQPIAAEVLASLEQDGQLHRLALPPLPPSAVGQLAEAVLADRPTPALVDWLTERTRGNPLYLLGLLRALLDEDADLSAPALRALPQALTGQLTRRVRGLDPDALGVLELLAVLGRRVELRGLVGPSGHSAEVLATALDTLTRRELVTEQERGPDLSYEVAHPLLQEAVYQGIGAARRRLLHRRAGQALLAADRLGAAAPHFAASAEPGDPEAVAALVQAVRRAEEREAYHEALEILASLVELLPAGDARWREVVRALSWRAQWVVDHRADGHALLGIGPMRRIDAVLATVAAPAERAMVKFRLASFLAWGSGELADAERECALATRLFSDAGDRSSALLAEHELAWIRALRGDLGALRAGADRIAAEARRSGDRALLLRATRSLIMVEQNAGRFSEGYARVDETIRLARATGDAYAEAVGLRCRAIGLIFEGRCAEALASLAPEDSSGSAVGADPGDPVGLNATSMAHWCAGNFPAALSAGLAALAEVPGPVSKRRGLPLFFTTLAAVEHGRLDVAGRLVARARQTYRGRDWFVYSHWMVHAEAFLAWRTEGRSAPLAAMRHTAQRLREIGGLGSAALVLADVAEVAEELSDLAAGTAAAAALTEIAELLDRDFYRGMAATAQALCALAGGDAEAARSAAANAVDLLGRVDCRAHQARALHVLGRALAVTDPAGAVPVLRTAGETFAECGAPWRQARTLDVLSGLGGPGQRAGWAVRGPSALTRREREVARMAAEGHSAREIAERLFISVRTVESHLNKVYAKLGVGSKSRLAARAEEFPL